MPLAMAREGDAIFSFPNLNKETYLGLPGMLADVLPDHFDNRLIEVWLLKNHRKLHEFNPIERLCYVGECGMGALTFKPSLNKNYSKAVEVEIDTLVQSAQSVVEQHLQLDVEI